MKKKTININEIALNTRRTWGNVKPCAKVFKSKRDYNRKDNSWKKEDWNMNTHEPNEDYFVDMGLAPDGRLLPDDKFESVTFGDR